MTIDDVEALASACVKRGNIHDSGPRIIDLARFVLLVLPVAKEAMGVVDDPDERPSVRDLQAAIDALRAAMEGK